MTTSPKPIPLSRRTPPDVKSALASVEAAIEDIRAGKMVILVDDADRENEGDLCMAAESVTRALAVAHARSKLRCASLEAWKLMVPVLAVFTAAVTVKKPAQQPRHLTGFPPKAPSSTVRRHTAVTDPFDQASSKRG